MRDILYQVDVLGQELASKPEVIALRPGRVIWPGLPQTHPKEREGLELLHEWGGFWVQSEVVTGQIAVSRCDKDRLVPGEGLA